MSDLFDASDLFRSLLLPFFLGAYSRAGGGAGAEADILTVSSLSHNDQHEHTTITHHKLRDTQVLASSEKTAISCQSVNVRDKHHHTPAMRYLQDFGKRGEK